MPNIVRRFRGARDTVFAPVRLPPPRLRKSPEAPVAAGPSLEVTDFTARRNGQDVIINWVVKNDALGMNYQIQRSTDGGRNFMPIADYRAKKSGTATYHCPDWNAAQKFAVQQLTYRLLYLDGSGAVQSLEPRLELAAGEPPGPDRNGGPALPPVVPLDLQANGMLNVDYQLAQAGSVEMILMTPDLKEVSRLSFQEQPPGAAMKTIDISRIPQGQYLLIVKGGGQVIRRFRVTR